MLRSKRRRRLNSEINAGSMADIAFLLLVFFLVNTTFLMDQGIMVKLPPWDPTVAITPLPENNVLTVSLNATDDLLVEGERMEVSDLRSYTKEFIMNPLDREDMPSNPKKAVVSILNDRSTSYESYLAVYNELKAAYSELRNEEAQKRHGKDYDEASALQQKEIRRDIPLIISEAEPVDMLGSGK